MTPNINRNPMPMPTINPSIGGGGPVTPNYTINNRFPELNPSNHININRPGNVNMGIHIEVSNPNSNPFVNLPLKPTNPNQTYYLFGKNEFAVETAQSRGELFQACMNLQNANYADSLNLTGRIVAANPNSYCAHSLHALNLFKTNDYAAAFSAARAMKSLTPAIPIKTPQLNWMRDFFITAATFDSFRISPFLGEPPGLSAILAYSASYFENHPIDDMELFSCYVNKLPGSQHLTTAFSALESNVQMLSQHNKWGEFLSCIGIPLNCVDFNNPYSAITASYNHRKSWTKSSTKNYLQLLTYNLSSPSSQAVHLFDYDDNLLEQWNHNIVQAFASFSLFSHANSALADELKKMMEGKGEYDSQDLEKALAEAEVDDSEAFLKEVVDVDEIAATVKLGLFGLLGKIFLPDEKSSSFDLGKEEPENCFVVFMNGIFNRKGDVTKTAEKLAKELNNKNIHIVHNASSDLVDLLEVKVNMSGKLTNPNEVLHKKIKELRNKDPAKPILLIGHSQGGLIINNHMQYMPDDWKANMHVCTLGGADWVPKGACKNVANYLNANDSISGLCNVKKLEHLEEYNATILPAENGGHFINSKNYIDAIKIEFDQANKK